MSMYSTGQKLRYAFNKLDLDRDGYIAFSELRRSLALTNNVNGQLSVKQRKRLMSACRKLDDDHDGRLDFNDFVRTLTKPDFNANCCHRFVYRMVDIVTPRSQCQFLYSRVNEAGCNTPPVFFIALSILQISSYVYYCVLSSTVNVHWFDGCPGCFQETASNQLNIFPFAVEYKIQGWRYFSHILVHSGFLHFLSNLIVQIFVGMPLEFVHKTWRLMMLYMLGVVYGALCHSVIDKETIVVGASGGCYSILVAHISHLFLNWSEMRWCWWRVISLLCFCGFDLSAAIFRRFTPGPCGASSSVSMVPNLGGLITGLCVGHLFITSENNHVITTSSKFRVTKFLVPIVYVCVFSALLCLNVILPVQQTFSHPDVCNFTLVNDERHIF